MKAIFVLPPNMSSTYPATAPPIGTFPPQGPLPNFRLPPPGTAPPYMPPGPPYSVPPRPMFDTSRPPLTGPPPSFAPNFNTSPRSHSRGYGGRRMRDRSPPPGIIDDPLAAFNRMLREKDERDRRVKQRNMRRSYSRSRSRSRSFSRSPRRMRSRSPRRRSRSRSFSMSRSRSRSYSGGSLRGSPYRQFSPPRRSPPPPQGRRGPPRYSSPPLRSPPRRHQNDRPPRDRDFDMDRDRDRDRDYQRDDRPPFGGKDKGRNRDDRDRDRDRDRLDNRDRYFDNYDDRRGAGPRGGQWGGGQNLPPRGPPDGYYHQDMQQHPYQNNRYPSRDYQPYVNKNEPAGHISNIPPHMPLHLPQPQRRFDDIAPPGVEEPPIPGLENMPPFERFDQEPREQNEKPPRDRDKDREKDSSKRNTDRETRKDERKRRHDKRSKTPEKAKSSSPKRVSKSKEKDSLDKHKKRRRDSSDRDDKKKDYSDDEKKRSKDKKRKKDKKEKDTDKKKKRDRREKHRKDDKEKKKDEFKQVIIQRSPKAKIEPEIREPPKEKVAEYKDPTPEPQTETPQEELKVDLYEDVMTEGIDNDVVENYGKINETTLEEENTEKPISSHMSEMTPKDESPEEGEVSKEYEDSEKDILELHTTDIDLKAELDKNEMLAPVPEKSKWEVEEDGVILTSPNEKYDQKLDKSGKVTNEVLKRAENAIFAKAINAIRPIEIKKISTDRAKLYSGEKVVEKSEQKSQVILPSAVESHKRVEPPVPPVRLSVKERLGVKVDDTDRVIKLGSRTRSRSISPFSKRNDSGRNYTMAERRVEMDYRNRRSRDRRRPSSRDRSGRNYNNRRDHNRDSKRDDHKRTERHRDRSDNSKRDDKKEKETKERGSSRSKSNQEDPKKDKRRRSKSRSDSEDRKDKRKKKDKKVRHTKDRGKKHQEDKDENNDKADQEKLKPAAVKRKPTLDESNFEPDYDLESESEKEDEKSPPKEIKKSEEKKEAASEKAESSSSDSSSSSSDDDRRKKKHKKHRKKKRRETSSSSSESESESSDDEKDKKRKKHKKKQKKKKKSRHK